MNFTPLRSALYMPGINQRAMDKARQLPADAIIFDLEDAVAPAAKEQARTQVLAQLDAGGYGRRKLVVRCNALGSAWGEADLRALAESPVQTVCLPKVESAGELSAAIAFFDGKRHPKIEFWAMIETPAGVANAREIAATDGLTTILMGTTDLASELRLPHRADRLGLLYALSECVLAARLSRVTILDGVYLELANGEGFAANCEQGLALGFDGKTLIHPNQIAVANDVYGPSAESVSWAARLLDAWSDAENAGQGVALLDGRLIESMHVDEARRTLALAAHIESMQPH